MISPPFMENMECIRTVNCDYVVIAPSYMIYSQDFSELLQTHIDSGADITLLYHSTDDAKEHFLTCNTVNLNKQKGVLSLEMNRGTAKNRHIFMDTYVMSKDLFIDLVNKAHKTSSMYSLADIVNVACDELDVRGVSHRGYFASITDFKSYYDANISLIDFKTALSLFDNEWPIYTRTNDSCPTQYFEGSNVKEFRCLKRLPHRGNHREFCHRTWLCDQEGRRCEKLCHPSRRHSGHRRPSENIVADKHARITHVKEIVADPNEPGYIKRNDTI